MIRLRVLAAAKRRSESGDSITSLDGSKTISWEDFERLFDAGSDEINAFIDWTKTKGHGGKRPGSGRKPTGKRTYQIRLRPEVHRRLKTLARKQGRTISETMESLVP